MNQLKIDKIKRKVRRCMNKERYEHTLGVMYTAAALAMRYHVNIEAALLAGLLHDIAKGISGENKIRICKKKSIPVSEYEEKNPGLLHAKLGAYIARKKFKVNDLNILNAITYHTTGRPNMTELEKVIYIADYIEPNRNAAPNLKKARQLAFENIDACLYLILNDSLEYLDSKKVTVDPMTKKTYEFYKKGTQ